MVQYKLKQRGFYYFNSIPASPSCVCVSVKLRRCERREAVSNLLPEEDILMREKEKGGKKKNFGCWLHMITKDSVIYSKSSVTASN